MIVKPALAITLYSLASARKALSFSPVVGRSFSQAVGALAFTSTALQHSNRPHLQTCPLAPTTSLVRPGLLWRMRLRLGFGKRLRERVVHKYFHGVDTKNIPQIAECFHPDGAMIRDVCSLANRDVVYRDAGRLATPESLGERCREFLAAHPDTRVMFHLGPTCGRGRNNNWVYAHWYEEGSWSGNSGGVEPDGSPLTVQGQTRFLVDDDLKIKEIVITRTFSRWEQEISS